MEHTNRRPRKNKGWSRKKRGRKDEREKEEKIKARVNQIIRRRVRINVDSTLKDEEGSGETKINKDKLKGD